MKANTSTTHLPRPLCYPSLSLPLSLIDGPHQSGPSHTSSHSPPNHAHLPAIGRAIRPPHFTAPAFFKALEVPQASPCLLSLPFPFHQDPYPGHPSAIKDGNGSGGVSGHPKPKLESKLNMNLVENPSQNRTRGYLKPDWIRETHFMWQYSKRNVRSKKI